MKVPGPVVALALAGFCLLGIYSIRDQPTRDVPGPTKTVTKTVAGPTKTITNTVPGKLDADCVRAISFLKHSTNELGSSEATVTQIQTLLEKYSLQLSNNQWKAAKLTNDKIIVLHDRLSGHYQEALETNGNLRVALETCDNA